jgi:prevent-host-death family protein
MLIKPSTLLRNDYGKVSNMARETGEPIYLTRNGEGDTVLMSVAAFESREAVLRHRAEMLRAQLDVLTGGKTYTTAKIRKELKARYFADVYDAK